jgi:hypothetical protein
MLLLLLLSAAAKLLLLLKLHALAKNVHDQRLVNVVSL